MVNDLLVFWFLCPLYRNDHLPTYFSLNITPNMQPTSPELLVQSTSPSSRQLEKNGLYLSDFTDIFSNLDFIRK